MEKQSKTPTLKPVIVVAIADYGHKLNTVKDLAPDDPARVVAEQSALKDLSICMRQNKVPLIFSEDRKINVGSRDLHTTLINNSKAASTYQTANLAMNAAGDAKALAILGMQGDTITRYPLNPYAINLNNSSSLLVINDATGQSRGIYHVAGDQFNPRLEYQPVTTVQALGLFEEAVESAKKIDLLNANNPAVTITKEQKYQGFKNDFLNHSTRIDTIKPLPPGARAAQKDYWDGDQDHQAQTKQKLRTEQFWGKVTSNYFDYVQGETKLLFEQPIMLQDGARNSYTNLYAVEQDGVPRIFMATRSSDVYFKEITHELAKGLIESGLSTEAAKSASDQFFGKLTEHGYFQQNASALSANTAPKGTPSFVKNQSGYAYAVPEKWVITESLTADLKQGVSKAMDGVEHAMNKFPTVYKSLGTASVLPALYEISKQTYEAGKESVQAGFNTATQGIAELDVAIDTGAMVSTYTLPLLANPYGELTYLGYTTLAAIGGSQAMQTLEDGAMWAWQKLAVEPLRAQAEARAAEKAQQEAEQQAHEAILNKIPDTPPPLQHPAQHVAEQVMMNAAKNRLSIGDTCTALNAAMCHFTGIAPESNHAADASHPAPTAQESLDQ